MTASDPTQTSRRPRPLLLVLIVILLACVIVYAMWPNAASPAPPPSNTRRDQGKPAAQDAAGSLNVRLDALDQAPPEPVAAERNPFRFYVKPPPPAPPPVPGKFAVPPPPVNTGPPPPPPIPLKFIGTMEQGKRKVAIFSDGRGSPIYGAEGAIILGQYRIIRIGVESVVIEYLDGRGRQTIPLRGQ
jgi:hypothetical protein